MTYNPADTVRRIKNGRIDCTDYLIHFTRATANNSSFEVLQQILRSGYIKSGWSVRNSKRTIFGPKPAVCFTEMPLWALDIYARNRSSQSSVDCYGIALNKRELFIVGARNVIYGTTAGAPEEIKDENTGEMYIADLPTKEQYRYMLTDIDHQNDWTHEREWRWAGWNAPEWLKNSDIDGLPLYKTMPFYFDYNFKSVTILVKTTAEKDIIISLLRELVEIHEPIETSRLLKQAYYFLY